MSFESLMAVSERLTVSAETLAALGAQLRFLQDGLDGDSRVRALLNDVAGAIEPQLLEGVEKNQQAAALALIRTMFRQALDLLRESGTRSRLELPRPGHPSGTGTGVASHRPLDRGNGRPTAGA